jgi:dCMP deaminase
MKMTQYRRPSEDETYMNIARSISQRSYAVRSKVGAVLVKNGQIISDGYNGTPYGFDNCCEIDANTSKRETLHAESNCILKLARKGSSVGTDGSTLYVTLSPCFDCAKLIIQAGIRRVVFSIQYRLTDGIDLLKQAGIVVEQLNMEKYNEVCL